MIKQTIGSKRSSTWQSRYEIKGAIKLCQYRPMSTRIENGYIVGSYVDEYGITEVVDGTSSFKGILSEFHGSPHLGEKSAQRTYTSWKVLPHRALVNLPTYNEQGKPITRPEPGLRIDPRSVEQFVRTYGVLRGARMDNFTFSQDIAEVAVQQDVLRRKWLLANDGVDDFLSGMMEDIQAEVQGTYTAPFMATIMPSYGYISVSLTTYDLWQFICYLFLCECWVGKTGVCKNPGCPAPYFVKRRTDQKFCEVGSCTQYAHRQAANKWWDENGQRWRAKKRIKSSPMKRK